MCRIQRFKRPKRRLQSTLKKIHIVRLITVFSNLEMFHQDSLLLRLNIIPGSIEKALKQHLRLIFFGCFLDWLIASVFRKSWLWPWNQTTGDWCLKDKKKKAAKATDKGQLTVNADKSEVNSSSVLQMLHWYYTKWKEMERFPWLRIDGCVRVMNTVLCIPVYL